MKHESQRGFSLIEMMVVLAIIGIAMAFAVPQWSEMQINSRAKSAARMLSNGFQFARAQAIMTEEQHVVMWTAVNGNDACGTALPSTVVILDDVNGDCCITAGEPVMNLSENPAADFAGINWGVTFAAGPVNVDGGGGVHTTGSSFSDQNGVQTHWVAFRNDGVPVAFTNTCALGQVGTGAGGIYFTNGGAPNVAGQRDYAVVLSALGAPKVYSWDIGNGAWTN